VPRGVSEESTPEQVFSGSPRGLELFRAVERMLAAPNDTRTTLGSNALWQLALLEMWLQAHVVE